MMNRRTLALFSIFIDYESVILTLVDCYYSLTENHTHIVISFNWTHEV